MAATHPRSTGKVTVITGASSGFGRGIALNLAHKGHRLVLAARSGEGLNDVIEECVRHREGQTVNAVACACDVGVRADIQALADKAVATFGRIDVWINNAGVGAIGPFEQTPMEDHQKVIETNLIGTILGCHLALAQFIRQVLGTLPPADARPTHADEWSGVEGTIINIASNLGRFPAPYYASYAASKHGVVGLSASLRQELHERGLTNVHICTVLPEAHDTPFFQHAANYTGHQTATLPPIHDPQKVIDAVVDLIDNPKPEVGVGAGSAFTHALHKIIPKTVERITGHQVHKEQIEKSEVAPPTRGAVHGPDPAHTGVTGGEREKQKRESGKK